MPFIVLLHSSLAIFFSSPIEVKQEIKFVSQVCISLQITIELFLLTKFRLPLLQCGIVDYKIGKMDSFCHDIGNG